MDDSPSEGRGRQLQTFFDLSQIKIITIPEPIIIKEDPKPVTDKEVSDDKNSTSGNDTAESNSTTVTQPNFIGDNTNWGLNIINKIKEQTEKYNITIAPPPLKPTEIKDYLASHNITNITEILSEQLFEMFSVAILGKDIKDYMAFENQCNEIECEYKLFGNCLDISVYDKTAIANFKDQEIMKRHVCINPKIYDVTTEKEFELDDRYIVKASAILPKVAEKTGALSLKATAATLAIGAMALLI